MNYSVFQSLFDEIEVPFLASVSGLVQAMHDYSQRPVQAALILFIALYGLMLMGGKGGSLNDAMTNILKFALVAWFVTDASAYTDWVQTFVLTKLPAELATAVAGGNGGTAPTSAWAFDMLWRNAWTAGLAVWERVSVADIGSEIVIILFWLMALIATGLAFAIWLLSHILLGLFIIIGPLMIPMVLFGFTRSMFSRWVSAMVSNVLLQVGLVILLTLTLRVEAGFVVKILTYVGDNTYAQLQLILSGVAVFFFAGVLAFQMPGWATSIAGGMHFHGGALALVMWSQSRVASNAIYGVGSAANKGIDNALGRTPPKPPGPSLSGGGGGPTQPWMGGSGGYAALSPQHQTQALKSYLAWDKQTGLGSKYGIDSYVSYVQDKQAKRGNQ